MLKVVMADDRIFEMRKLKGMLDWSLYGMEIVGEASNGREAFNLCLNERADILITDIKMPVMDGLDLARALSAAMPDIKIILLSAYSDFQYARQAIELNICGYLLKPYNELELTEALSRAVAEISEQEHRRRQEKNYNNLFSSNLAVLRESLLYETITSPNVDEMDFWSKASTFGLQLEDDFFSLMLINPGHSTLFRHGRSKKREELISIFKPLLAQYFRCFYILPDSGECLLLLNIDGNLSDTQMQEMLSVVSSTLFKELTAAGYHPHLKCSSIGYGVTSWPRLYNELTENQTDFEPDSLSIDSLYRRYKELEPELFAAVLQKNAALSIKTLSELLARASESGFTAAHLLKICLSAYSEAERLRQTENIPSTPNGKIDTSTEDLLSLNTVKDVADWLTNLLTKLEQQIFSLEKSRNHKKIDLVLSIIHNQYSDPNLNLLNISAQVYFSPNYLRTIFKEITGKSFSSYLTEYRIEKACDLLKDPARKIADIPEAVGLSNNSHFYLLFKKTTGCTPGEYRFHYQQGT
ncbi:MAG: response regulator [Ruminococcaceae bacterium]|nr:response regulator [Oscillospiraceae bacterium]